MTKANGDARIRCHCGGEMFNGPPQARRCVGCGETKWEMEWMPVEVTFAELYDTWMQRTTSDVEWRIGPDMWQAVLALAPRAPGDPFAPVLFGAPIVRTDTAGELRLVTRG